MLARSAFSRISNKATPEFTRTLSFDPAGSWGMGKSKKRKQRERAKKQIAEAGRRSSKASEMDRADIWDVRVDHISSSYEQVNQKYSHGSRDVGKGQSQDAGWRSHSSRWNNDHHSAASPLDRDPSHDVYRDNYYDHHGYGYGSGSSHEFTRGSSFRDQRDAPQSHPASTLDQPHFSQSYSSNRSHYSQNRFGRRQNGAAWGSNQHPDLLHPQPSNPIRSFQTAQSNYSPKGVRSNPRYHQKSVSPPRIGSQNRWSGLFNHREGSESAGSSSIPSSPRASASSSYQPSSLPQNPYDHHSASDLSFWSKLPKREQGTGRKLSKKERAMQGSDSFGNRDNSSSFYLDPRDKSSDNSIPEDKRVWKNLRLGGKNAFANSFSNDSDDLQPSSRYLEEASMPSQLRLDLSFDSKSDRNQRLKAPLLILDLNGTLLFRKKSALSGASSMKPELRPFLETFLRYCLGFGKDANGLGGSGRGRESKARRDGLQETEHEMDGMDIDQTLSLPHGTHFWSKEKKLKELKRLKDAEKRFRNEEEEEKVRYQVLIWSSAQPQNVDSMVQAIFNSFSDSFDPLGPSSIKPDPGSQDSELSPSAFLRIYARDTLVDKSQYFRKSPSIKNLEIIWKALNESDESELLAEDRKQAEWVKGRGSHVRFPGDDTPRLKSGSPERKETGYGSNNTLLLDDSSDKARMQPFNHLLLHEFDSKSAKEFRKFKRFFFELRKGKDFPSPGAQESISDQSDNQEMDDADDDPDATQKSFDSFRVDTTLIEVVGILEHARYQTNVCNWIKEGGLGSFGSDSTSSSKPSWELVWKRLLEDEGEKSEAASMEDEEEEAMQMLESSFNTARNERNDDFWLKQGLNTLRKHGIRLKC